MSALTEHLEQRGSPFELLPHRQASTSTDAARALGIDAGEVLKTLAVRTGIGYVLVVIPASCRLDLHLVREALGDHQARLASEEDLARDFAGYPAGRPAPARSLAGLRGGHRPGGARARPGGVRGRQPDRVGQDPDPGAVRRRADHDRAAGQAGGPGQRGPNRSAASGAAECGRRQAASTVVGSTR